MENILDMQELTRLLDLRNFGEYFKLADEVRKTNVGDEIQIRALLEFSNYCKCRCQYCGLNSKNRKLKRFRMDGDEIIAVAKTAAKVGYKTIVLQSGEDVGFSASKLAAIVKQVSKTGMKITLSCGEFRKSEYAFFRECGADRYLLKHETADEEIYANLHPGYTLESRITCLKNLKSLGYEVGSGFMIGLPNQTNETIAKDILLLKEIGCDMAGIGPFIPHPETPLANKKSGSIDLTRRAVALTRLVLPKANLPAATSVGVVDRAEKNRIFSCGANVVMQKITPNNIKRLYEIYPSNVADFTIEQGRELIEQEIKAMWKIPL